MYFPRASAAALFLGLALCATPNFDYEEVLLTEEEAGADTALAFGDPSDDASATHRPQCKSHPGDESWPSESEWESFNESLGGVLLHPSPPGAACYPDHREYDPEQCAFLVEDADDSRFWIKDPLTAVPQWAQGNTCRVEIDPAGECTQGGYPAYVVNATTVRHIQMAVNFARNNNIRLTIRCAPPSLSCVSSSPV